MHLIAWITEEDRRFVACYSLSGTLDQPPATHTFPSLELARAWIYFDADKLGARILWLDGRQKTCERRPP